jgi:hypothetical protein
MKSVTIPGFNADTSTYQEIVHHQSGKMEFFTAGRYQEEYSPYETSLVRPAAKSVCNRLGAASWAAHDAGDFRKVAFIEMVMGLVGCFD